MPPISLPNLSERTLNASTVICTGTDLETLETRSKDLLKGEENQF